MKKWTSIVSLLILLCLNILCNVQNASAQNAMANGEMLFYGDVFIRSSTGDWIPAPGSYPILQDTVIRTKKGSASLYYKDGSRIDLAESTIAALSSKDSGNSVHLSEGRLAVNTNPQSSFTVSCGSAEVLPQGSGKKGSNTAGRFIGIVSSDSKRLAVQSISGTASLKVNGSVTKEIPSGSSTVITPKNEISHYQAVQGSGNKNKCYNGKQPKKNCSPYTFTQQFETYCYDY